MDWLTGPRARQEFERFVADSAADLLRTSYLLTWNLAEGEDLVQEALLRAARRWPTIRVMDFPRAYVRRTLVNLALGGSKRRARANEQLELVGVPLIELQADELVERELSMVDTRAEILSMLATLPTRQRAVLVLRYFQDLSESEIAAYLNWPIGTVKSTTSRALGQLQRSFDKRPPRAIERASGGVSRREVPDEQPT